MSNFRFNFSGETENNDVESKTDATGAIQWLESYEVVPDETINISDDTVLRAKMFMCGDVEYGYIVASTALATMESGFKNAVSCAEEEDSDLVAGIYEGGLKLWECTYDLVEYLESDPNINFEGKNVLDLGCGAGILGIYAFFHGSKVTFQDYNREVLEYVTLPNVLLNIEQENVKKDIKDCKFYCGDWKSFNEKLPVEYVYDYILTSETIYNSDNYGKLLTIFKQRLKKDGVVFLAAKNHYFGVGGGIRQFEQLIDGMQSSVCWESKDEGIKREILKITHNKP